MLVRECGMELHSALQRGRQGGKKGRNDGSTDQTLPSQCAVGCPQGTQIRESLSLAKGLSLSRIAWRGAWRGASSALSCPLIETIRSHSAVPHFFWPCRDGRCMRTSRSREARTEGGPRPAERRRLSEWKRQPECFSRSGRLNVSMSLCICRGPVEWLSSVWNSF